MRPHMGTGGHACPPRSRGRGAVGNRPGKAAERLCIEPGPRVDQSARGIEGGADPQLRALGDHGDDARGVVRFGEQAGGTGLGQRRAQLRDSRGTGRAGIAQRDRGHDPQIKGMGEVAIGIMKHHQSGRVRGGEGGCHLEAIDGAVGGLLEAWDDSRGLLIITSDHGNLEETSHRQHTRNPVPTILVGRDHARYAANIHDLTDIAGVVRDCLALTDPDAPGDNGRPII